MDTYDMEVQCGMYCQGGSVKGVLEPYGYGSWVKVEDAESLTAERDRLASDYAALDEALNECIKDRDWFSDRLDAATAELARVKAESLRVVPDTQHGYHYMTPSGIGWHSVDKSGNPCVETPTDYHDFADCTPVRLERWEDEE